MPGARVQAIDDFRGLAILLMVPADFLSRVRWTPAWFKHAPDIGYTMVDLIAPMFVLAIGLTYGLSFRRRQMRDGTWRTVRRFAARYLMLLGLGALLTWAGDMSGVYVSPVKWGLLQALGAAGLLTLPLIGLPAAVRMGVGLGMLAAYQWLLDTRWLDVVRAAVHNGPWGALSWGGALVVATALADAYHAGGASRRRFALLCFVGVGLGLALAGSGVPVSKVRASASYMVLSLGLSGLVLCGLDLLAARGKQLRVLGDWGFNPLLLYLLHGVFIGVFAVPAIPWLHAAAPAWLSLVQIGAILVAMSAIARWLRRRQWALSL